MLAACSISTPPQQPLLDNTEQRVVDAHQQRLKAIYRWQLSARLAIIQKTEAQRDGLYLDWRWQRQPDSRQQLRFSHPLKGQLATLTILPQTAQLTLADESFFGSNPEALLQRVLGVRLPLKQLPQWVLGKQTSALKRPRFIRGGRLAAASFTDANAEHWQIQWFYANDTALLPAQIELESAQLHIKMQLNDWHLTPELSYP